MSSGSDWQHRSSLPPLSWAQAGGVTREFRKQFGRTDASGSAFFTELLKKPELVEETMGVRRREAGAVGAIIIVGKVRRREMKTV